ncbi:hypothetical protein ASZ90_011118 [hydrocarbon metagenome]|uniref:Uncharacterized protein n=1 Tax=hydrocarbon metagenome TaxID=938273 RepID=A0A0W8FE55_9ZZZZ|nr:hypothetical protein [Methanomicrobiaceae archaeon]
MIIPPHCKVVGCASGGRCGDRVYFLTRYLIREEDGEYEVLEVETDPDGAGLMRRVLRTTVLAAGDEVCHYPDRVQLHNRTFLVERALESGRRCTIFTGYDEHTTFVLDPDLSGFLRLHVYDIEPPRPHLSATLRELEKDGLFGDLEVVFVHHLRDIREADADVYPCRAAGFSRTLDKDPMHGGERIAGCRTGAELYRECYGDAFELVDICPLDAAELEPFIARCCRSERGGIGLHGGRFGAVVHWGASPREIALAALDVIERWRSHGVHCGC